MIFDNTRPVFQQLVDLIINDIYNGKYKSNDKLPSVRELANLYTVNPNTVLAAFKELLNRNIIYTQRGVGYFVIEDLDLINSLRDKKINELLTDFIRNMKDVGLKKEDIIRLIKEANFND